MPSPSLYRGGYNEVTARKMKSVVIPEKLRCLSCKTVKSNQMFSNKQLQDLKFKHLQYGPVSLTGPGYIKCRQCTGQQVTEMECTVCDEVKPLSEFGKNHRREPDKARCRACIDEQAALLPGYEDVEDEDGSEDSNDYWPDELDSTVESDSGGAPLAEASHGLTSLRLAQHDSRIGSSGRIKSSAEDTEKTPPANQADTESGTEAWSAFASGDAQSEVGDGVWTKQTRGQQADVGGTRPFIAFDPAGFPHQRFQTASTTTSGRSWAGYPMASGSRNSKFAKPSRSSRVPVPSSKSVSTKGLHNINVNSGYDEDDDEDDDDYMK
ncbi:hypothetical protein MMC26_000120 [Xylographa opegraphella]|nr:hypothetical protein [Xylographa opegraphella]